MYMHGFHQMGVIHEYKGIKNIEDKEWNLEEPTLLKTIYEDIETGLKITIYKNEIKGKITENNLDKIAREKIEKEILKKNGLYEERIVNLDKFKIEDLFEMDDNLVFTIEECLKIDDEICTNHWNLLEKYDDLSDEFHFGCFNGYETKNKLIDFVRNYYVDSLTLENGYFEEIDKEVMEERKELYYGDDSFLTEEFEKKEQVEERIKNASPLFNLVLCYLKKLNIGLMGERKTDEEMDKEYGEYCVFKQERSRF